MFDFQHKENFEKNLSILIKQFNQFIKKCLFPKSIKLEKNSLASTCRNCGKVNRLLAILKKCNIETYPVTTGIAVAFKYPDAATRILASKVTGILQRC